MGKDYCKVVDGRALTTEISQAGMELHEHYLEAKDGTRLFVREAEVVGKAKAHIVLTHGRGEHSGRYLHVAAAFASRGLKTFSYDLRGHGHSGGKRGDTPGYDALLDDLDRVVQLAQSVDAPLFLFGHSLGAQIVVNYILEREPACRGAIIASPYLRLAFQPEWWRLALARVIRSLWPSLTLETKLISSRLSRDGAHLASLPDLDLVHHRISVRMYEAVKNGAARAFAGAPRLRIPVLLLHGTEDSVTSAEATREFHALIGAQDKTLAVFPGMLHETHNEIGREEVIAMMTSWIETRS